MSLRIKLVLCLAPLLAISAVVAWLLLQPPSQLNDVELAVGQMTKTADGELLLNIPGISSATLMPANQVRLGDAAEVIGVSVGDDQHRCYLLKAFEAPAISRYEEVQVHVVNDLAQGRAISVTYCDVKDCIRVFHQPTSNGQPLPLAVGGWSAQRGMLLLWQGARYLQQSQAIPLGDHEFIRTTWKEWRERHPKTLVYVGAPAIES